MVGSATLGYHLLGSSGSVGPQGEPPRSWSPFPLDFALSTLAYHLQLNGILRGRSPTPCFINALVHSVSSLS